jgi:hypothetical protein
MTLGFGVGFTLETNAEPADVDAALVTLARHSPVSLVRVVWFVAGGGDEVREVDADGRVRPAAETARILRAVDDAGGYLSWPSGDAPLWVPGLILPGGGWDVAALMATPAMRRLAASWRDIEDNVVCGDDVRLGPDADALLAVAARYHLLVKGG